jgi:hypothetical protein
MTSPATSDHERRRPDGPHPGILAIVSLAFTIAAVVASVLLGAGQSIPSPLGSTASVAQFYLSHPDAAAVAGFLVFGSSIPLGIFAATVYARMLRLGIRVPGPGIGYFGGIAAAVMVGIAGVITWVTGQAISGQSTATIHTLAYLSYALGGVGFVTGVGLLIAGIAVPALILGLVPRWLAWVGLAVALICEVSFVSMLVPALTFTLPIGRFAGLAWLIAIGFVLPRTRHEGRERRESAAAASRTS